jgi:predicted nuclease with TOPRIM domain
MRTENQIKRKLNELLMQKQAVAARLEQALQNEQGSVETVKSVRDQLERIEDMISMLEWVLDQPTGSYHTRADFNSQQYGAMTNWESDTARKLSSSPMNGDYKRKRGCSIILIEQPLCY